MLVALLLVPHVTLCLLRPEVREGLDMAGVIRYSTLTQCVFSDTHPGELCLRVPSLKRPGEPWSQAVASWVRCSESSRSSSLELAPGYCVLDPEGILIEIQLQGQKMPLTDSGSVLSLC